MAGVLKRLAGPAHLAAAAANVYNQASSSVYDEVKQIIVANKTDGAATFSLFVGATGASASGTEIFSKEPVPARTSKTYYMRLRLDSTDFLTGLCETGATTLAITVMGERLPV